MQMPLIAEVQHSQLPFMVGLIQQHFNEKVCCSCLTCMLQTGEVLQDVTFLLKTFQLIVLKPYAQGCT